MSEEGNTKMEEIINVGEDRVDTSSHRESDDFKDLSPEKQKEATWLTRGFERLFGLKPKAEVKPTVTTPPVEAPKSPASK